MTEQPIELPPGTIAVLSVTAEAEVIKGTPENEEEESPWRLG